MHVLGLQIAHVEEGEGSKVSDNLKWDHSIRILGRPVKDPLLHICEVCSLPILIYGRMVGVRCQ